MALLQGICSWLLEHHQRCDCMLLPYGTPVNTILSQRQMNFCLQCTAHICLMAAMEAGSRLLRATAVCTHSLPDCEKLPAQKQVHVTVAHKRYMTDIRHDCQHDMTTHVG